MTKYLSIKTLKIYWKLLAQRIRQVAAKLG